MWFGSLMVAERGTWSLGLVVTVTSCHQRPAVHQFTGCTIAVHPVDAAEVDNDAATGAAPGVVRLVQLRVLLQRCLSEFGDRAPVVDESAFHRVEPRLIAGGAVPVAPHKGVSLAPRSQRANQNANEPATCTEMPRLASCNLHFEVDVHDLKSHQPRSAREE